MPGREQMGRTALSHIIVSRRARQFCCLRGREKQGRKGQATSPVSPPAGERTKEQPYLSPLCLTSLLFNSDTQ